MNTTIDVSGVVAGIDDALRDLSDATAEPLAGAWKKVADVAMTEARSVFDRSSDGGGEWQALAESTVAEKGHDKILIRTRRLRKSLDTGGNGNVLRPTKDGIECGTGNPVAHFHQEGGGRLPRRRVLPKISDRVRSDGREVLAGAVLQILQRASAPATPKVP